MKEKVFKKCQCVFHGWAAMSLEDFEFDDPKGFSSFTMGIRSQKPAQPDAVLYRHLDGKENAILDFETEKEVFLTLSEHEIATHCHHYDKNCRIEAFYHGRTLTREDLFEPDNLRQIANQLYRFHQLRPPSLPQQSFFDLLLAKWGRIAKRVLEEEIEEIWGQSRNFYFSTPLARIAFAYRYKARPTMKIMPVNTSENVSPTTSIPLDKT